MTTTYTIFAGDVEVGTKSKKSTAVDLARQARAERGVDVRVVTQAGTEVFVLAAPKKIKMSPPYTRVVDLPEGVVVPDGMRVAYFRPRRNAAVLHDGEEYFILDTASNELRDETFATTRDAGKALVEA